MDYSETTPKLSLIKTDRIRAFFQTQLSFEDALAALQVHGYSRAEIVVQKQAEVAEKHYFMAGPVDEPDAVLLQKAIRGIGYGALMGGLLLGLAITYLILFQPHMLQAAPLASILFGLAVGGVWGGTLGFIIGPLRPFNHHKNYDLILSKGQVLLSFQPKTLKDEHFFKSLHWPTYSPAY